MPNQPTVSSVTDGLAKLIRDVRLLQREVGQLAATLRGFTGDRLKYRWTSFLPPEANPDKSLAATGSTQEPRSAISDLRYEFARGANLDAPTRTLLAIGRELDNALRDIRAARLDIKSIADDSDLREEFRAWQQDQR